MAGVNHTNNGPFTTLAQGQTAWEADHSIADGSITTAKLATAYPTRASLGLDTTDSPQFTGVNVGAATDTTITRVSAGVIAVEGSTVLVSGGALGTPASGVATNLTGTAASLTAGTVTTNANLTGDVTSSGNATTIGSGKVTEAMQVLADNTTQNASTSKHGYLLKLDNTATHYMDGTGAWSTPAGSTPTVSQAFLAGDVSITANTFADGPSLSLAAGTYLLDANLTVVISGAAGWTTVRLMNGSTPITSTESYNNFAGAMLSFHISGYVVLGSLTTCKVQATNTQAGTITTTPAHNATGLTNLNAYLRAVKIA